MSDSISTGFNRAQRMMLTLAAFVIVIAGIRAAKEILISFLLALFIAIVVYPLLGWLRGKGVPTIVAILLILLMIISLGFLVAVMVGSSLTDFSSNLPAYQRGLTEKTRDLLQFFEERGLEISDQTFIESINPGAAMRLTSSLLTGMGNLVGDTFIILLVVVFMLLEAATFGDKLNTVFHSTSKEVDRYRVFIDNINRYMVIKTWISLGTGVIVSIFLSILGVDYALLWGLLAFMLNYIPNIGSILAAIAPVLLSLIQIGPGTSIVVAAGFLAINTTIGNLIEPRVMGKGLGLSTLVVFLSLLFWGWVLGPVGMILSVPLTMSIKIALLSFEETVWLSTLLDSTSVKK
jgi:predicted PurR-regulated permease PerM